MGFQVKPKLRSPCSWGARESGPAPSHGLARGLCSSCAEQGGTAEALGSLPWRALAAFSLSGCSQLGFISARS